jgi:hypothetical protein
MKTNNNALFMLERKMSLYKHIASEGVEAPLKTNIIDLTTTRTSFLCNA